jgi:hypothetical protein
MHTLATRKSSIQGGGGEKDSSPSSERREWHAGAASTTDIGVVNGAKESETL